MDALKLAFRVALDDIEVARLNRIVEAGEPAVAEVGDQTFQLKSLGDRKNRFVLANADATLCVGADPNDFCVTVDFRALFLRATALPVAIEVATNLALKFSATTIDEVRVRRLDLFADATGLTFSRDDEDSFVTRARSKVRFQAPEKVFTRKHDRDGQLTGFVIAPGNGLQVRIYDKTEELFVVQGEDSEKTRSEWALFAAAGWDGTSAVWRVEAQLRTEVLQELGAGSPDALSAALDGLWHYVVGTPREGGRAWLRLVERGTASRAERCATDTRWRVFQAAQLSGLAAVERAPGRRGGVAASQALGTLVSYLAGTSNLDGDDGEQPADELMRRDLARAAQLFACVPHLLDTYRRRRAAARGRFWAPAKPKAAE